MELTFPWASAPSKALDSALSRASAKPLPPLRGDRIRIEGPLPQRFKRHTMRNADRYRIDVSKSGHIFGLSEVDGSSSGGFGGSCIPVAALIAMLNLWASQQAAPATPNAPRALVQGELF